MLRSVWSLLFLAPLCPIESLTFPAADQGKDQGKWKAPEASWQAAKGAKGAGKFKAPADAWTVDRRSMRRPNYIIYVYIYIYTYL